MKFNVSSLPNLLNGELIQLHSDYSIDHIFIDSRHAIAHTGSLFFAINGQRHNGHEFMLQLYHEGVRNFIIEQDINSALFPRANIIKVKDSITALQELAYQQRKAFKGKLIAITGSNGKTITKEWLGKLLEAAFPVYKSPRSYNSQVGVPLSLWHLNDYQDYAIIEAGISKVGEMQKLQNIVRPQIGIFTNLGTAHDEGFTSLEEKAKEKARLFEKTETIIFCKDYPEVSNALHNLPNLQKKRLIGWSFEDNTSNYFVETEPRENGTAIRIPFEEQFYIFKVPFSDFGSLENITHCLLLLILEGVPFRVIQTALNDLRPINMRLEVKKGKHNTYLVDDTYNNDLVGLDTALHFFRQQQQYNKRIIILSDLLETGLNPKDLYPLLAEKIKAEKIDLLIGIGNDISTIKEGYSGKSIFFDTTESYLSYEAEHPLSDAVILIKGARKFSFENIVNRLEQKIHGTVLEINLNKITHNLNYYRAKLKPRVRTMAMVKAFAYGNGSHEIANWLQFQKVDYLAVAYVDEGVLLRQHGIKLPIMVMNPDPRSFELLQQYQLEPELYSLQILEDFAAFSRGKNASNIHLKLDTGMHRLGYELKELSNLKQLLQNNKHLKVVSIFSHLAGSDEAAHNGFSARQALAFKHMADELIQSLGYKPLLHLLNSPGISRFPDFQFDMVRIGVGMYGVDATGLHQDKLQTVSTLKTVISQIKHIKKGETIGYSRKGLAHEDMKIATISIGYADGFNRQFSQGVGSVNINQQLAPVIGNICMDMSMVDVTHISCKEGDEVIVFGESPDILSMAKAINTIPYEILTNISERVRRIFYTE